MSALGLLSTVRSTDHKTILPKKILPIMKISRFLIIFLLITLSSQGYAQVGLTSYSVYALGINTSQSKKISAEFKTFTNQKFEDLSMELEGFYNFKTYEYHRFSVGAGVNFDPFKGFDRIHSLVIPLELEIFPIKDFKKFSVLFELTPEILPEDGANLRNLWGIRYSFRKTEQ